MNPAFTLYKYKKLVGLVFVIMILLAIASVLNPAKQEAKDQLVNEFSKQDQTEALNNSYQLSKTASSLDPKSNAEQKSGNFFMNLLNENPEGFLILVLVIAGILFIFGVPLKSMRSYTGGLQRGLRGW